MLFGLHRCWWQISSLVYMMLVTVDHQHPLSLYISVGNQHSKDVTNIETNVISPTLSIQYDDVTNITVSAFLIWLQWCWWFPYVADLGCHQYHRHPYHDVTTIIFASSLFECHFESEKRPAWTKFETIAHTIEAIKKVNEEKAAISASSILYQINDNQPTHGPMKVRIQC